VKSEVSRGPILEDARMADIAVKSRTANNPSRRREESARVVLNGRRKRTPADD
jgi:hypothetical protein